MSLRALLKCFNCQQHSQDIYTCSEHHVLCSNYPRCRCGSSVVNRNMVAENMRSLLNVTRCQFVNCGTEDLTTEIVQHEMVCPHRMMNCHCFWQGPLGLFVNHLMGKKCAIFLHPIQENIFRGVIGSLGDDFTFLCYNSKLLRGYPVMPLLKIRYEDSQWYFCVQALAKQTILDQLDVTLMINNVVENPFEGSKGWRGRMIPYQVDFQPQFSLSSHDIIPFSYGHQLFSFQLEL